MTADAEQANATMEAAEYLVGAARRDFRTFFRLVMRSPDTREPIDMAPHQLLGAQFALHHPKCVLRWPIDTGKTVLAEALALWFLGQDPMERGMLVGKVADTSKRPLKVLSDYLTDPDLGAPLRLISPHMCRSSRAGDTWTSTTLTTNRPAGSGDASLIAIGVRVAIQGKKVGFQIVDDLLDQDNTATRAQRANLSDAFHKRVLGRLDPDRGARCIVINVPWDKEDLTYELESSGWPTLTMDIWGNVSVKNAADDFDTELLRPSRKKGGTWHRLTTNGKDADERAMLWEARYPRDLVEEIRRITKPHVFASQRECNPRPSNEQRCKPEWIDAAKKAGAGLNLVRDIDELEAELGFRPPVFVGVDCGLDEGDDNDRSSIVAAAVLPGRTRRMVHAEHGRWDGPDLLDKVLIVAHRFDAIVAVESNAAQRWLLRFARKMDPARLRRLVGRSTEAHLRLRAHYTGQANKQAIAFGVEGVFLELQQGLWIIPSSPGTGVCSADVQSACDACLDYRPPPAHTPDELIAWWICCEQIRKSGDGTSGGGAPPPGRRVGGARRAPLI